MMIVLSAMGLLMALLALRVFIPVIPALMLAYRSILAIMLSGGSAPILIPVRGMIR
ncbi:hypothetical protein D3C81_1570510 [compost metagenome]